MQQERDPLPAPAAPPPAPGPGARLRRAQRIRKRAEFVRIQESPVVAGGGAGRAGAADRLGGASAGVARVTTRHLLLLLASRADDGPARLGVVASRKVGPAVSRNRAKRLVREAFRLQQGLFPAGIDVVVIVRPGTHRLGRRDLDAELAGAASLVARRARELRQASP